MGQSRIRLQGARRSACAAWGVACCLAWAAADVQAAGTAAGTLIENTATIQYRIGGNPPETASATAPTLMVAKVLNVTIAWQDAAPTTASSPAASRPLSFVVTNTGNAAEPYRLTRDDNLGGDQFDPVPSAASLWLESGAQPGFQASGPNADIPYAAGVNDPVLPADGSRVVYLLSDIPAGVPDTASGRSRLTATATTPGAAGAAPGAAIGTFGGVPTVAGTTTQASAIGSYLIAGVSLGLAKTVTEVRDPQGGTRVMAGSVVTYRIVLTFSGSGVADAVTFSDPLPAALSYLPGSLVVDGAGRTDAADGDGAAVSAGTVSVDFASVTAPAQRVIVFKATVN